MKTIDKDFLRLVQGGQRLGRLMSSADWFEMLNPKDQMFRFENWSPDPCSVAKVQVSDRLLFLSWVVVYQKTTGRYFACYWAHRRWNISRISYVLADVLEHIVIG